MLADLYRKLYSADCAEEKISLSITNLPKNTGIGLVGASAIERKILRKAVEDTIYQRLNGGDLSPDTEAELFHLLKSWNLD